MPGFEATRSQTNTAYPPPLETFIIPASLNLAIALGDVIIPLAASGSINGIQTAERLTIGAVPSTVEGIIGIVNGNDVDPDNEVVGIPANSTVDRQVRVNVDPYQLYEVDVDNTTAQGLLPSTVGLNVQVISAASTVSSLSVSGQQIDGNVPPAINAAFPFRLVGYLTLDPTDTFITKAIVRPNLIFNRQTTGAD